MAVKRVRRGLHSVSVFASVLSLAAWGMLAGCSSSDPKGSGDMGGGAARAGAPDTTDEAGTTSGGVSSAGSTSGGVSGNATAGTSASGGSAGATAAAGPFKCRLASTDCASGTECYVEQHGDGSFSSECAAPGGAAARAVCARSSDCQAGLFCNAATKTCQPTDCSKCASGCGQLASGAQNIGEVCLASCSAGEPCSSGMTCRSNLCGFGAPAAEGEACAHSLACADGLTCSGGGKCVRVCDQKSDCPTAEYCAAFGDSESVVYLPSLSIAARVCVAPCSVSGSACAGGRCYPYPFGSDDPGDDTGVCGTPGPGKKDDPCTTDDGDCGADLSCMAYNGKRACRSHCMSNTDCAASETCLKLSNAPTSSGLCVPSCSIVTGSGCQSSIQCKPAPTPDGSKAPGCVSAMGTTCVGSACSDPLGFGLDPCGTGAICVSKLCRRTCDSDADCVGSSIGCGSLGSHCTAQVSDSIHYCE